MPKKKNKRPRQDRPAKLTEDGFVNPITNAGLGMPNPLSYTGYEPQNFSSDCRKLTDLYKSHWIVKRIVDSVAGDMVKGGYTITSQVSPDIIDKVNRLERLLHIPRKIMQGLKWSRLYGGAAALILINNQGDMLDEPLEIDTVMPGDFRGLFVFDRFNGISPAGETIRDLSHPDYGLPEYYRISAEGASSVKVHHSRICRFNGRELPPSEFKTNQYWGASELEHVYDELTKRDNVSWNIALLSFMANLRVLKLDGLGESLGASVSKMQNNLYSRLQAMNAIMNSQGIQVLGKDDEFQTFQYAFGGLGEIYDRFMMDIAGACEIPVTKLFGRSPAGMNATGESDLANYYDMVEERKESMLRPVYDKLLPLLFMSVCGMVPDDLDYIFNSSRSESEREKTERGAMVTNTVNSAMQSGVISQKIALMELRAFSERTGLWTNISDKDIEEADDSAEPLPDDGQDDSPVPFV